MSHPIIVINSAEIQIRYSDIINKYVADIILNNTLKVTSEFMSETPGALYEMMRDAGIQMQRVIISFKWEPDKYSNNFITINMESINTPEDEGNPLASVESAEWIKYVKHVLNITINNNTFEYPETFDTMMEAFNKGCEMIKKPVKK